MAAAKVIDTLEWLGLMRGLPDYIRSDNGPEFVAKAIQQWLKVNHCQTIYNGGRSPGSSCHLHYPTPAGRSALRARPTQTSWKDGTFPT